MTIKVQDKFGPGLWFMLHLNAAHAKTDIQKRAFIEQVRTLGEFFPCENCKKHFAKYISEHPITDAQYLNQEDGLFRWTWEFHESVNKRLGKPSVSYTEALSNFTNSHAVCTEECGDDDDNKASNTFSSSSNTRIYTILSYETLMLNGRPKKR